MVAMARIYDQNLHSAPANYTPLNPTSFLTRAERGYSDHAAMIDGRTRRTWSQAATCCRCLAGALSAQGIGTGDTVVVMPPKIPEVLEAHYDVPMIGAMLNLLNIRLNARWCWHSNKALVVLLLRM
jgi:fatty-acyl-CoA synthase